MKPQSRFERELMIRVLVARECDRVTSGVSTTVSTICSIPTAARRPQDSNASGRLDVVPVSSIVCDEAMTRTVGVHAVEHGEIVGADDSHVHVLRPRASPS